MCPAHIKEMLRFQLFLLICMFVRKTSAFKDLKLIIKLELSDSGDLLIIVIG